MSGGISKSVVTRKAEINSPRVTQWPLLSYLWGLIVTDEEEKQQALQERDSGKAGKFSFLCMRYSARFYILGVYQSRDWVGVVLQGLRREQKNCGENKKYCTAMCS